MANSENSDPKQEVEDSLLYSARHGELKIVKALLEAHKEGKLSLDINCKGKTKSNLGWTPLILATYFGHVEVVGALLDAGADVDDELVILLLKYKADVNVMNGEGRTACDVCKTRDVQRLLEAAQRSERHERERKLLNNAKAGNVQEIQELAVLQRGVLLYYGSRAEAAQEGGRWRARKYLDGPRSPRLTLNRRYWWLPSATANSTGCVCRDNLTGILLLPGSVRPVQRLQRTAARFEGPLLKRSRFLGWRPVWAVLQRGVLLYYGSRAEAAQEGGRWRARKYLDGATLTAPDSEPALLVAAFSDGEQHRLCLPRQPDRDTAAARQVCDSARGPQNIPSKSICDP
ncbi:hypothetical protein MSG28_011263 [Choristoneura fumiferana]|uniref:Uncharacterized protein n=1 Tax=Choristoneura fumiferana TaxID=7141 RepID=A0ACC0KR12_CHOFU|nr:hypothetical protein MSG28_011263 [Choristoneura fumiferana]